MNFEEFIKSYNEIYKAYNRVYHKLAVNCGLSDSALNILYELRAENRAISQKDLGIALSLSKQTVNSAIMALVSDGLVEIVDSEQDKRTKLVNFTKKGELFAIDKIDKIIQAEERAFLRLSPIEARQMVKMEKQYFEYFLEESNKIKF